MAPTDSKYKIDYTVSGTADHKRKSLVKGGPLKISPDHWLSKILKGDFYDDRQGWVDLHLVEFICLGGLVWDKTLIERNFAWYIQPERVSRFLADLDEKLLLSWEKQSPEEAAAQLTVAAAQLPLDSRRLTARDVHAYNAEDGADYVFNKLCASPFLSLTSEGEQDVTAAIDFKCVLADAYVKERREDEDGHFQGILEVLLEAAGTDLTNKGLAVQAAAIAGWWTGARSFSTPSMPMPIFPGPT